MDNKHSLKLIDGTFTPSEARKVMFDLINSKINYHNMEAFSIKERFNGDTSYCEKRIKQLKETRRCLEEIINYTLEERVKLRVTSFINITFIEEID